jgi:hypothetical protein
MNQHGKRAYTVRVAAWNENADKTTHPGEGIEVISKYDIIYFHLFIQTCHQVVLFLLTRPIKILE